MRISPAFVVGTAWCLVLVAAGCGQPRDAGTQGVSVTVSILPQKYFVNRIGGDLVRVNVMVPPGASPATYEPKPSQIRALSDSAIYFAAGVPFEASWLGRLTADRDDLRVVDTSEGIEKLAMIAHSHHDHDHHSEEASDPHTWMSPKRVKTHATNICNALCEADPDRSETYRMNLDSFHAELENLDRDLADQFDGLASRAFLVFHPSWGYFADDYGLRMIPLEVGGQEPSAFELGKLIDQSRAENIRVILAQPEFNQRPAEFIAREIGADIIQASPLDEAWADNLRRVAAELRQVLLRGESE